MAILYDRIGHQRCTLNTPEAPSALKRNMPPIVPVLVPGRMAVDSEYQGVGSVVFECYISGGSRSAERDDQAPPLPTAGDRRAGSG